MISRPPTFQAATGCSISENVGPTSRTIYLLPWLRLNASDEHPLILPRTKSRYANDKAVNDFTRVGDQVSILTEQQRIDEAAAIIGKDSIPTAGDIDRLGRLLGDP